MSAEVAKIANSPVMWIISLLTVGLVAFQAILIYRLTKKYAETKKALTPDEMKAALKTGGVVAIGPAISVFVLALSMISLLGAPATLMRIGIIGSATTEMTAATVGAMMAGVSLGADELTLAAFGCAMFGCAVMSCGYLIMIPILSRGLGKGLQKLFAPKEGGKQGKAAVFFGAVFPVLFILLLTLTQVANGMDYVGALIIAGIVSMTLDKIAKKKNIKWLKEWGMGISVLAGMISGPILGMFL